MNNIDELLRRVKTYANTKGISTNLTRMSKEKRDKMIVNMDQVDLPEDKKEVLKKALTGGNIHNISKLESMMMNITNKKKVNPPITINELEGYEKELGFSLPILLRKIYMEVGNGGFGPGYGLLPLKTKGYGKRNDESIVSLYKIYMTNDPDTPEWNWDKGMVPICTWGDNIYSCVDCTKEPFPIYRIDIEIFSEGDTQGMVIERPSIYEWIEDMVEDRIEF